MVEEDTIAAISTPLGRGGIGLIRISGPAALTISKKIFVPHALKFSDIKSHQTVLGKIVDPQCKKEIDQVLLTYFKHPKSFTKEDVVELSCHGSPLLLTQILEILIHSGVRLAKPGEFTYRAFINGRIDLTQAEALNDLIQAKTKYQAQVAFQQLQGSISQKLKPLDERFKDIIARCEANIDFEEGEFQFISRAELSQVMKEISQELEELEKSFDKGRIIREGISLAIVGKPNVGKSSLFNRLLKMERAIVTEIPGTTRDLLIESANIEGIPIRCIDTAGIRGSEDMIEKEGIRRSQDAIEQADLIIVLVDGSCPLDTVDREIIAEVQDKNFLLGINKIDLKQQIDKKELKRIAPGKAIAEISAKTGQGEETLKKKLLDLILGTDSSSIEEEIITNVRHKTIISETYELLDRARRTLNQGLSEEFILSDLNRAYEKLGEITGRTSIEDILGHIFSKFCIGK
jgi:tRNA modification GTPase